MDTMTAERSLQFEGFTLDLDRLCLLGPTGRVDLRRKSFDVLRHLVEHTDRVVSKDELMKAVWPDVTVSDELLTQCISEVRRALGDQGVRIIKTVARRGYLIDVPVSATPSPVPCPSLQPVDASRPPHHAPPDHSSLVSQPGAASREDARPKRWVFHQPRGFVTGAALAAALALSGALIWTSLRVVPSTPLTMMAVPTVAVLPFAATGSVDRQRSVAAGIEAEVRSNLAMVPQGFELVIRPEPEHPGPSSWSKLSLAQPAARYVVSGTTWGDAGGLRANVRLVETETNRQIWSESFDLDAGRQNNPFNRTAARIARLLVIQIQAAESRLPLPANPVAGHYALLGRVAFETERGPESTRKAQALFEKALSLDANCVPALQGFARTRVAQALNAWIPAEDRLSTLVEAGDAIDRSIRLDARNAVGHVMRGAISRTLGDIDKAIASLEYALSLNPNLYVAHSELAAAKIDAGLADELFRHIEEALQLAPAEPNLQILYFYAGYAALHVADDLVAVKWFLKARAVNSAYTNIALWLAAAYLGIGEEQAARASLAEYLREKPRFSIEGFKRFVPITNPIVAKQRKRIMDAWRRLGIPETPPS